MLSQLSSFWTKLKPQYDDDSVDRLNYIYTNIIILAFAITIAAKQYVGEPLQCWVPAQFKGGWEKYVENYCFVENTYWVPMHREIPTDHEERNERELTYYQWVPFVLAIQALMFYLPKLVWNGLNGQTGVQLTALIQAAFSTSKEGDHRVLKDAEKSAGDVAKVAKHFRDAIDYQRDAKDSAPRGIVKTMRKTMGIYLTTVYLVTKLLYIVNVLTQFLILNAFLGPQYTWWGFGILRDIINGVEWESSGHFPRVTLCDFEVRRLGNLHRWTVQCVLMLNMINEKIYLFLWWWFLLVAVLTIINFIYWVFTSLISYYRHEFVRRYLIYKKKPNVDSKIDDFVSNVLRADGVLILRLISDNAGDIITSEIVSYLWDIKYNPDALLPPKKPDAAATAAAPVKTPPPAFTPIDQPDATSTPEKVPLLAIHEDAEDIDYHPEKPMYRT